MRNIFQFSKKDSIVRKFVRAISTFATEAPSNISPIIAKQAQEAFMVRDNPIKYQDLLRKNSVDLRDNWLHFCDHEQASEFEYMLKMMQNPHLKSFLIKKVNLQDLIADSAIQDFAPKYFMEMIQNLMKYQETDKYFDEKVPPSFTDIPPHFDYNIELLSLFCVDSGNGATATFLMDPKIIFEQLSSEEKAMASCPVFQYSSQEFAPLFWMKQVGDIDKEEVLHARIDTDKITRKAMKFKDYEIDGKKYSAKDFGELFHKISNMTMNVYEKKQYNIIILQPGDVLFFDNERTAHGRFNQQDENNPYAQIENPYRLVFRHGGVRTANSSPLVGTQTEIVK